MANYNPYSTNSYQATQMKLNERSKDIPNYKRGEFLTLLFFHSQLKISTFGEQVSLIYFPIPTASASSSVKLTSNQSFAS